jgi:SAM-dependent methyltransferase
VLDRALTSLRLRALDAGDRLTGCADPFVPPRRRQGLVGQGDNFAAIGDEFIKHFEALAGLEPGDHVLDIGCGVGRMARPLRRVLDPAAGGYEGFDVDADAIAWCQRRYATVPHFHFRVADVANGFYRPDGHELASRYRFPYDDASFDLVLATSVFTHLLEPEAERYLAESARVLRPGGRLFATFFLLDDASREVVARGQATLPFRAPVGSTAIVDADEPEAAIAFDADWVTDRLAEHGLDLRTIEPGTWAAPDGRTYQDIVVAQRSSSTTC